MNWKDLRKEMDAALKAKVVPLLKAKGFKGSYPHFRRISSDKIDVIGFQFSQWGPQFYVEVAASPLEGVTFNDRRHFPPEKIKHYHCWPRRRIGDDPFDFEKGNFEETAQKVVAAIPEGEDWWHSTKLKRNSQPDAVGNE